MSKPQYISFFNPLALILIAFVVDVTSIAVAVLRTVVIGGGLTTYGYGPTIPENPTDAGYWNAPIRFNRIGALVSLYPTRPDR